MSLNDIPPVVIDANGRFKYILIKLTKNDEEQQYIVRGFASAEYHGNLQNVTTSFQNITT